MTAAVIDSRDFVNAKRRSETQVLFPTGARIAFTGGPDCNDHDRIWAALDKVRAKHADMVLLHGGTPTGAERIAACWADARKVPQIAFRPDWNRHHKAAPFKRNDHFLDARRSVSWPSQVPASPPTSATKPASSESRYGASAMAARERRPLRDMQHGLRLPQQRPRATLFVRIPLRTTSCYGRVRAVAAGGGANRRSFARRPPP